MTTSIQKWGNSLAVRIPKVVADEIGFAEDTPVELNFSNGIVTIAPRIVVLPTLDEMLDQVTPESIHPETDWGLPVGKEIW